MHSDNRNGSNQGVFLDSLANEIIRVLTSRSSNSKEKGRKSKQAGHLEENADELAEFIEYLASDCFECLPVQLQEWSFTSTKQNPALAERYSLPLSVETVEDVLSNKIPATVNDSLTTYAIIPSIDDLARFFIPVLSSYLQETSRPPLTYDLSKRSSFCEICKRDWIPLTYHHLIPRQVHAKVLKRGWHEEWQLEKVAWLCRQCHSFVHGIAGNEELAREWWSVELLLQREDVQSFANWIGRARWKPK